MRVEGSHALRIDFIFSGQGHCQQATLGLMTPTWLVPTDGRRRGVRHPTPPAMDPSRSPAATPPATPSPFKGDHNAGNATAKQQPDSSLRRNMTAVNSSPAPYVSESDHQIPTHREGHIMGAAIWGHPYRGGHMGRPYGGGHMGAAI